MAPGLPRLLLLAASAPRLAVSITLHGTGAAGACDCLQWSSVYGELGVPCQPGLGGLAGDEFCGFGKGLKSNVCLQQRFMTPEIVDSVCYVSGKCQDEATSETTHGLKFKTCDPDQDAVLVNMSLGQSVALAKANGVDQGCLAGYATTYKDALTAELSDAELQKIKDSGVPTFIWSMRDHFAPRWEVKGEQVFEHRFDPGAVGYWTVTCIQGCA